MEAWSYPDLMFLVTDTTSEMAAHGRGVGIDDLYHLFQPRLFYDIILWEAGKLVYAAEETSFLRAGCGTGGTKPLMLKHTFAREAKHCGSLPEETKS